MKNNKNIAMGFYKVLIFVILGSLSLSTIGQVSFGEPQKINDNWKFTLNDPDKASNKSFDDKDWRTINLPHDWSVKGKLSPTFASCTGYLPGGIAWYRKTILVPETKSNKKTYLYFEGVYNRSEVYINGHLLGKRPNGYISFMYDASEFIEYGKDNIIAVRVDHSKSADSRWYTGSGIYRDVYVIYANPVHIAQWGVFVYPKSVDEKNAVLSVEVEIENGSKDNTSLEVKNELLSADGKTIAQSISKLKLTSGQLNKISVEMEVKNPHLWKLSNPYQYQLKQPFFKKAG